MSKRPDWDEYFITIADAVSRRSNDPNTRIGVVVVGPRREIRSTGYNGFPYGMPEDPALWSVREHKYLYVSHAEANAIYHAARNGVSLLGCTLYLNWAPVVCSSCAKAIVQVGIREIVGPLDQFPGSQRWYEEAEASKRMFEASGVIVRVADVKLR